MYIDDDVLTIGHNGRKGRRLGTLGFSSSAVDRGRSRHTRPSTSVEHQLAHSIHQPSLTDSSEHAGCRHTTHTVVRQQQHLGPKTMEMNDDDRREVPYEANDL